MLTYQLSSPLRVDLGQHSYEIHVAPDALRHAGRLIASAVGGSGFIITHPRIERLHGKTLRRGLGHLHAETILVPAGERQKSLRRAGLLWDELLRRKADRESVVIAFGGGVIGDLAGFIAATYMRGLPFVQVPTTLLAQVDASVGGKVAINRPAAKNLIGAFYQPRLVIADVSVLSTLSVRDYREGLAEVVKTALIADPAFFEWLEVNRATVLARDAETLAFLVHRCCEIKAAVVQADERESGPRAVLNLGHTIGHALESVTGYRALRHGEAVAIGMAAAARVSGLLGRFSQANERRLLGLLAAFGLPIRVPGIPAAEIAGTLCTDKKAVGGVPRFVLLRDIGQIEWGQEVAPEVVQKALIELGASD